MCPVNQGWCTPEAQSQRAARASGRRPGNVCDAALDVLRGARAARKATGCPVLEEAAGCRLAVCPVPCDCGKPAVHESRFPFPPPPACLAGFRSGRPGAEPVLSTRHGRAGHGPGLRAGKDLAAVTCLSGGERALVQVLRLPQAAQTARDRQVCPVQ